MGKFDGMTLNERLVVAGLMVEFEQAIKGKNLVKMIGLLKSVELTSEQAQDSARSIIENPERFGYPKKDVD